MHLKRKSKLVIFLDQKARTIRKKKIKTELCSILTKKRVE